MSLSTNIYGGHMASCGEDWSALYLNLQKARTKWMAISRVLIHDADKRTAGIFYKAVAQSVLLYDCETWVITTRMLGRLEVFHNRIARRLTGRAPVLNRDTQVWCHPPLGNHSRRQGSIAYRSISHDDEIPLQNTS
jgi:hypothetical protein